MTRIYRSIKDAASLEVRYDPLDQSISCLSRRRGGHIQSNRLAINGMLLLAYELAWSWFRTKCRHEKIRCAKCTLTRMVFFPKNWRHDIAERLPPCQFMGIVRRICNDLAQSKQASEILKFPGRMPAMIITLLRKRRKIGVAFRRCE